MSLFDHAIVSLHMNILLFFQPQMADLCLKCTKIVTKRQQAIECDDCSQWCHRTCGTGITAYKYKKALSSECQHIIIMYVCK